ncbi:MAG: choice-of-anchor L domain-containing protein [Cyanobacteriota bacterium]|nr:choice-of-anchor L domain-containing protein [Cyanobacteriota bacterium]
MQKRLIHALGALGSLAVLASAPAAKALNVSGFATPEDLVSFLLVPGWTAVPGSVSLVEAAGSGSVGFFTDGASAVGLNEGVILTSGLITNALPPNDVTNSSGPGTLSSLSFDVIAPSSSISWTYVFASEEYEEYVGSMFNDLFTLSIDGTNIAFVPGTTDEVRINNVNQNSNTAFYKSNYPIGAAPFETQYDGMTIPLTAVASGLTPGQTYTISFMVTDIGDGIFVYAVFIDANSVSFPGGSMEDPLLPPPPMDPDDPWVFPSIVVTDPEQDFWYDPIVSIGYIYSVDGGPLFDKFTGPDLPHNTTFDLFSTAGACSNDPNDFNVALGTATELVGFSLPNLPCFAVKGINPVNLLDPMNTTAFVAALSFNTTGMPVVTQLPINFDYQPAAVPSPLSLFGAAAAFGSFRKLRSFSSQLKRHSLT